MQLAFSIVLLSLSSVATVILCDDSPKTDAQPDRIRKKIYNKFLISLNS